MTTRSTPTPEPWLSRRHWRRLLDAYASGRITPETFADLKRKLARVRRGAPVAAAPVRPLLRVLPGGARRPPPAPSRSPFSPTPLEAA